MESLLSFLGDMTVWNWLTLIAFVLLPISVLNSVLSLRSRFKDWRSGRSKITFDARLKAKMAMLDEIVGPVITPTAILIPIASEVVLVLLKFIYATFWIFMFVSFYVAPEHVLKTPILLVTQILAFVNLGNTALRTSELYSTVHYALNPSLLAANIIAFIESGQKSGHIEDAPNRVQSLINRNVWSALERLYLSEMAKRSGFEPPLPVTNTNTKPQKRRVTRKKS